MERGFQEADIHEGKRARGIVQSAFIVVRPAAVPEEVTYVAYLRTSWRVGYHRLELSRYRGERIYRDLGRLVFLLQDIFEVRAPVKVFRAGCSELNRFRNLMALDQDGMPDLHRANPMHASAEQSPEWESGRFPAEDREEE